MINRNFPPALESEHTLLIFWGYEPKTQPADPPTILSIWAGCPGCWVHIPNTVYLGTQHPTLYLGTNILNNPFMDDVICKILFDIVFFVFDMFISQIFEESTKLQSLHLERQQQLQRKIVKESREFAETTTVTRSQITIISQSNPQLVLNTQPSESFK